MAPSEFDLRAALRDGEGEGINPDHVISAGEQHRARRRSRVMTAAVVVALVAGGGVGISQFGGSSGGGGSNSADAGSVAGVPGGGGYGQKLVPHQGVRGSLRTPAPSAAISQKLMTVACPPVPPIYQLPQDDAALRAASAPLFTSEVAGIVVCSYGTAFHAVNSPALRPARLALAGGQAAALARSMENAARYRTVSCPPGTQQGARYAVIGVTPSWHSAGPTVSAQVGCNGIVTNGTALRFSWSPPAELARRLQAARRAARYPSSVATPPTSPSPTG